MKKQYNISINIINIKHSSLNNKSQYLKKVPINETRHANPPNRGQPPNKKDNNDLNNRFPFRLKITVVIIILFIILLLLVFACLIVDGESFSYFVQLIEKILNY